jgi:hypothetical protein
MEVAMTRTGIRRTSSVLAALAFAFASVLASSPASAQLTYFDVYFDITVQSSSTQTLRICINGISPRSAGDGRPTEEVAFYFTKIINHVGDTVLEKELSVPPRGFRCADFSYAELAAVLGPDPATGAVSLRVDITPRSPDSSGDGDSDGRDFLLWQQTSNVGAIMLVDMLSGKVETYEPLRAIRRIGTR